MTLSTEILILFLLVLANGFLVLSEIPVVSARTARLQERATDGGALRWSSGPSPAGSCRRYRWGSPWWVSWPEPSGA